MSSILQQYYKGITQQLRAEVEFINTLFHHQGVKGEGNETALRDLITRFIPKRYGVGTGIVVDHLGQQSRQCDIVVYDTFHYPSLLALSSVHLFPIELVYATIEVKTTLTAGTAKQALENIASVRGLQLIPTNAWNVLMGSAEPHHLHQPGSRSLSDPKLAQYITPPLGFVFAYKSETPQVDTVRNWFVPVTADAVFNYPSMIGCLDVGLMYFVDSRESIRWSPSTDYRLFCHVPQDQDPSTILLSFLLLLTEMIGMHEIHPDLLFSEHYLPDDARIGTNEEVWRPPGWEPRPFE